jgi:hypothetical protein
MAQIEFEFQGKDVRSYAYQAVPVGEADRFQWNRYGLEV